MYQVTFQLNVHHKKVHLKMYLWTDPEAPCQSFDPWLFLFKYCGGFRKPPKLWSLETKLHK